MVRVRVRVRVVRVRVVRVRVVRVRVRVAPWRRPAHPPRARVRFGFGLG